MRFTSLTYQDISGWCSGVFAELRKTRRQNLATLVYGLVSTGRSTIAAAARSQGNGKAYATNRQRLRRFLKDRNVTLAQIGAVLIPLVVRRFPADQLLSIILDTTSLVGDEVQCLTAAVAWKGRALPVAAVLYRKSGIPDSQNRIEQRFIRWLLRHVPDGWQICVVADRGFGRTSLIQFLQALAVDFVLRVKHDVTVTDALGKTTLLSKRWVKTGRTKLLPGMRYRADQAVTVNLVLTRQAGAKEPWYLATSLTDPTNARHRYEQRFQIEETFKDAKHQLGLEDTVVTTLRRLAKVVGAILTAILILLFLGAKLNRWRQIVDRARTLSTVSLALWLLKYPPPYLRRSCLAALSQAQEGVAL